MQKVVHASLNGNAYAFEEAGHAALRAYLDHAATQLGADPDRDEILGDLEQAIADKCSRHLAPHQSVVTTSEMQQVLDEMGPVGTPGDVGPDAPPPPQPPPAVEPERRLYRVLEGGKLAGLCNGLGAYFGIDANLIRAIFVVLALLTQGAWVLVYLVLVFVVPAAGTPEERAVARGLSFSAQHLIDEAKRHYANLEKELQGPWAWWKAQPRGGWRARRQEWRTARRESRRVAREARRAARAGWAAPGAPPQEAPAAAPVPPAAPPPVHYAQQVASGVMVPLMAFLSAAFAVASFQLAAMLVVTGKIVDWSPGLPLWASLLILVLATTVITRPIDRTRARLLRAPYRGGLQWLAAWDGILWVGFFAVLCWLVWSTPGSSVQALVRDLPGAWEKIRDSWNASR